MSRSKADRRSPGQLKSSVDNRSVGNESLKRTFATWHEPPPADPVFLRRVRRLRFERFLVVVGIVGFYVAAIVVSLVARVHVISGLGGTWGIVAMLVIWAWTRRARPDTVYLFDLPPTVPQFPVDVTIRANDHEIGRDSGALSFIGDVVRFEGRRTSFELSRGDVVPSLNVTTKGRPRNAYTRKRLSLFYRDGANCYRVSITPYDRLDGVGRKLLAPFTDAAFEWTHLAFGSAFGSAYPPRTSRAGSKLRPLGPLQPRPLAGRPDSGRRRLDAQ